jgi:hypothetical protein
MCWNTITRPLRFGQLGSEPRLHFGGFFGDVVRVLLQARIEHDSGNVTHAEGVVVRPELLAVFRQRFLGRLVSHVVIPGHQEEADVRVQPGGHALEFRDLRRVARRVDQVARQHHERGLQAVGRGHRKLEVGGLLREPFVLGVHPELRVGHLDKRLRRERRRKRQRQ